MFLALSILTWECLKFSVINVHQFVEKYSYIFSKHCNGTGNVFSYRVLAQFGWRDSAYNFAHICFVLVNASQICSGTCKCNLRILSTYPCLEAEAGTKEVKLKVFNPCSVPGSKKGGIIPNFAQTCSRLLRTIPGSSSGRGGRRFLCAHLLQPAGDSVPFFGALVSAQVCAHLVYFVHFVHLVHLHKVVASSGDVTETRQPGWMGLQWWHSSKRAPIQRTSANLPRTLGDGLSVISLASLDRAAFSGNLQKYRNVELGISGKSNISGNYTYSVYPDMTVK